MKLSGRNGRQILLLSLLLMIVPMVAFPERFGTSLGTASLANALIELVFYGLVVFFFNRKATLVKLFQVVGLCFIYRISLGVFFGALITLMYKMNFGISLTMGITSYIPGIFLHILSAPFVLKPLIMEIIPEQKRKLTPPAEQDASNVNSGMTNIALSKEKKQTQPINIVTQAPASSSVSAKKYDNKETVTGELNGFDKATKYIGESATVELVAVVDNEGLLLSNYVTQDYEAEDWAPLALVLFESNGSVMQKAGLPTPKHIDFYSGQKRIILVREDSFYLMVVAEQKTDDLINIRVKQGVEIIKKYINERYDHDLVIQSEKSYV